MDGPTTHGTKYWAHYHRTFVQVKQNYPDQLEPHLPSCIPDIADNWTLFPTHPGKFWIFFPCPSQTELPRQVITTIAQLRTRYNKARIFLDVSDLCPWCGVVSHIMARLFDCPQRDARWYDGQCNNNNRGIIALVCGRLSLSVALSNASSSSISRNVCGSSAEACLVCRMYGYTAVSVLHVCSQNDCQKSRTATVDKHFLPQSHGAILVGGYYVCRVHLLFCVLWLMLC